MKKMKGPTNSSRVNTKKQAKKRVGEQHSKGIKAINKFFPKDNRGRKPAQTSEKSSSLRTEGHSRCPGFGQDRVNFHRTP